jgi:hypothetical protein
MGVKGARVDEKKQEGGKGSSESGNMEAKWLPFPAETPKLWANYREGDGLVLLVWLSHT